MDASYCQTSLGGDGVSHQQFLHLLEKQDKKGFNDLATLLSQLPMPAQGFACSMSVA